VIAHAIRFSSIRCLLNSIVVLLSGKGYVQM